MNYKLEATADGALRISVGNYTFVKPDPTKGTGYGVSILRYGEPWVEHPPGENAIANLLWLVEELHQDGERAAAVIKAADEFVMDDVRKVPDLFNALRNAVFAYKKGQP